MNTKWVMNAYHGNKEWITEYTDNVVFYDKIEKNVGSNIYDYMSFIVDNYENLPDVILFGKTNMLERHITKEEFDVLVDNTSFTPLLTQSHHVYDPICHYDDGMYCELNDYWYLLEYPTQSVNTFNELKRMFKMDDRKYNRFAPGGCYIVSQEDVLQHTKDFYTRLRDLCNWSQSPGEAYLIERNLYYIWK